ncbi:hypothetical protein ACLOJK_019284 [Asimina triloba]
MGSLAGTFNILDFLMALLVDIKAAIDPDKCIDCIPKISNCRVNVRAAIDAD